MKETLQEMAARVAEDRCGRGCGGCPAESWRDENGVCLIRRIAKIPELKPCPFCGGAAEYIDLLEGYTISADRINVGRINVGSITAGKIMDLDRGTITVGCSRPDCIGHWIKRRFDSREDAARAWNWRGDPAKHNCDNCKYARRKSTDEPCVRCSHCCIDFVESILPPQDLWEAAENGQ